MERSNSDRVSGSKLDRREDYSYGTNQKGRFRDRGSNLSAGFFLPYLQPEMTLVDCGCGPGTITVDLAAIVAPGKTLGIDIGEVFLGEARILADERGLDSVRFEQASIYEIPCADESVDAVFIHAVLHHLNEPSAALQEAYRILKPGGIIGVRELDFGGGLIGPTGHAMAENRRVHAQLIERSGGNPYIGRNLCQMLLSAGMCDVLGSATYDCRGTVESVQDIAAKIMWAMNPESPIGQKKLDLGLADKDELKRFRDDVTAWSELPGAFWAGSWCEAVGHKCE